ncbi:MAG: glycoside hydrolase family 6 protein [Solirubrobacteraceae bacterium]
MPHSMIARLRGVALAIACACACLALTAGPAAAGVANAGIPGAPAGDPLAGLPWSIYTGTLDGVYPAYQAARGRNRQLLAKIALVSSVHWFGAWDTDGTAGTVAHSFIEQSTDGNPDALTQIAVFRLDPWEQQACSALPDAAQQAGYRTWINNFAAGIGDSRVMLILQPDLPFALCAPGHSLLALQMVAYAARVFDALPYTTVYIDAGAGDWESVSQAAWLLENAGVRYARGFALNDTHSDSTGNELAYGAQVSRALGAAHIPGRHFVINTAQNGAPYLFYEYPGDRADPSPCATRQSHMCLTLGIPPTTDTADPRWGLAPNRRAIAASLADAYVWVSRPWLDYGSYPFDLPRALAIAATTPF